MKTDKGPKGGRFSPEVILASPEKKALVEDIKKARAFKCKVYMIEIANDHIDKSNVLDTTGIAESCCRHFDLYEGEGKDETPEYLFELAQAVERQLVVDWRLNQ